MRHSEFAAQVFGVAQCHKLGSHSLKLRFKNGRVALGGLPPPGRGASPRSQHRRARAASGP